MAAYGARSAAKEALEFCGEEGLAGRRYRHHHRGPVLPSGRLNAGEQGQEPDRYYVLSVKVLTLVGERPSSSGLEEGPGGSLIWSTPYLVSRRAGLSSSARPK